MVGSGDIQIVQSDLSFGAMPDCPPGDCGTCICPNCTSPATQRMRYCGEHKRACDLVKFYMARIHAEGYAEARSCLSIADEPQEVEAFLEWSNALKNKWYWRR